MFTLPAHAPGADLLWWRSAAGMRTVVSLLWGRTQSFKDALHLQSVLFDAQWQPIVT